MRVDHHLISEVPNVLDRVAGSEVVVKDWSCELLRELTLQDLFGERGVKDFGSCLFLSAMELQLRLLDLPLDQVVEGLYVRELLDPPLSLVVLNSCSEMRRIIVEVVLHRTEVGMICLRLVMSLST